MHFRMLCCMPLDATETSRKNKVVKGSHRSNRCTGWSVARRKCVRRCLCSTEVINQTDEDDQFYETYSENDAMSEVRLEESFLHNFTRMFSSASEVLVRMIGPKRYIHNFPVRSRYPYTFPLTEDFTLVPGSVALPSAPRYLRYEAWFVACITLCVKGHPSGAR